MAARKSCTHMTWAEAKAKVGGGDSGGISKKKGEKPKKLNHTEKLIAKNTVSKDEQNRNKVQMKQQQRQEQKWTIMAEKKAIERSKRTAIPKVKPILLAKQKQKQQALEIVANKNKVENVSSANKSSLLSSLLDHDQELEENVIEMICQCKEMQLSELTALESLLVCSSNDDEEDQDHQDDDDEDNKNVVTSDRMYVCASSKRSILEELVVQGDGYAVDGDPTIRNSIVQHPLISIVLQLVIKDDDDGLFKQKRPPPAQATTPNNDNDNDDNDAVAEIEPVACILLQITLPPMYPLQEEKEEEEPSNEQKSRQDVLPYIEIISFECHDENLIVNADKIIESIVELDNRSLVDAMNKQMKQILPDLVIYEICISWIKEHIFDYCTWRGS